MFTSQNTDGEFLITYKVTLTALFLLKIELAKKYPLLNYVQYNLMYS